MKRFTKTTEDFICEVCGKKVKGTGYTDHCPRCLTSKHVDVFPGDRQAKCQGLMKSMGITKRKGKTQIFYQCQKCDYKHFNKIAPEDNQGKIIQLASKPIENH